MSFCTLTDSAKKQIDTICEENEAYAVTLNIKGGGCAGFEYEWGLYDTPDELEKDDEVFKTDTGCTLAIGSASVMFLVGTQIDYKKDIMGSMFEISNPNAQSSCGCGISVNFDMDKLATPLATPAD
jgi:iron-sulfur cluster assembly accessory protein